jgi:hypothetical protein
MATSAAGLAADLRSYLGFHQSCIMELGYFTSSLNFR